MGGVMGVVEQQQQHQQQQHQQRPLATYAALMSAGRSNTPHVDTLGLCVSRSAVGGAHLPPMEEVRPAEAAGSFEAATESESSSAEPAGSISSAEAARLMRRRSRAAGGGAQPEQTIASVAETRGRMARMALRLGLRVGVLR